MIITGLLNEKEEGKVKAHINIQVGEYQLKGFKLYEGENEDGEKQLKLMTPSYMDKDEKGEIKKDKEGNILNRHPIIINPDLSNKGDLFKKLENLLVDAYNEFKDAKPNEQGKKLINKEVDAPEFEKGELNVSNIWLVNSSKVKNPDYQLKSTNNLLIGAFRINEVSLIYNTQKNDFNFITPSYEATDKDGRKVKSSFFVPKNSEAYAKVKNKIIDSFKAKEKEYIENYKKKKLTTQKTQAQNQSAAATQQPNAPKAPTA